MLTTFQIHSSISVMVCLDVVCCAEYSKTKNLKNRGEGKGREPCKKIDFLFKCAKRKQVQFPIEVCLGVRFPVWENEILNTGQLSVQNSSFSKFWHEPFTRNL